MTFGETAAQLDTDHYAIREMIATLRYWNISSSWVSHMLTTTTKGYIITVALMMLPSTMTFCSTSRLVMKASSIIITPKQNYTAKKVGGIRTVSSASKVTGNVFWDNKGCMFFIFRQKGKPSMWLAMFQCSK